MEQTSKPYLNPVSEIDGTETTRPMSELDGGSVPHSPPHSLPLKIYKSGYKKVATDVEDQEIREN